MAVGPAGGAGSAATEGPEIGLQAATTMATSTPAEAMVMPRPVAPAIVLPSSHTASSARALDIAWYAVGSGRPARSHPTGRRRGAMSDSPRPHATAPHTTIGAAPGQTRLV